MINVWSPSCRLKYVVCKITVKLMTNSDTGGIIIRMAIGKVYVVKIIIKQAFLLNSEKLAAGVLSMTLK